MCVNESDVEFDQGKPATHSDFMDSFTHTLGTIFEAIGDVASTAFSAVKYVWKMLPQLDQVWSYLTFVFAIVSLVMARVMCRFLPKGVLKTLAKKTIKAMRSRGTPQQAPAPTVVVIQRESENEIDEMKTTQEFL